MKLKEPPFKVGDIVEVSEDSWPNQSLTKHRIVQIAEDDRCVSGYVVTTVISGEMECPHCHRSYPKMRTVDSGYFKRVGT